MEYRPLGRTGLEVSAVGLGAWEIGGAVSIVLAGRGVVPHGYGSADDRESIRLVHRCEELGINFVDTAPAYGRDGHSEQVLGQALKGRRDRWIVATKGGHGSTEGKLWSDFSKARLLSQMDESLTRLQTDRVDVYLLHNPRPEDIARGECLEALAQLKDQGKARSVGVSLGGNQMGVDLCRRGSVDVLQQAIGLTSPAAIGELLPAARDAGVGVVARGVFASGFLAGVVSDGTEFPEDDRRSWLDAGYREELSARADALRGLVRAGRSLAQLCIRFVLDQAGVTTVIAGSKSVEHMEENARAGDLPPLADEEQDQLRKLGFTW